MLRTAEEMITDVRQNMRGGEGEISIKNLFQSGDLQDKTRLVAEVTVPPQGSIGLHPHNEEEEIYYFISGNGEVDDHGQRKPIKAGDAMVTGNGQSHAVYNTGSMPLVFLAVIILY